MGKLIFWIVVIVGVLLIGRLANLAAAKRRNGPGSPAAPPAQPMVRCLRCGTFLPASDAKAAPGGHVCGDPGCTARR